MTCCTWHCVSVVVLHWLVVTVLHSWPHSSSLKQAPVLPPPPAATFTSPHWVEGDTTWLPPPHAHPPLPRHLPRPPPYLLGPLALAPPAS